VSGDVRDRPRRRAGAHPGALALAVAIAAGVVSGCGGDGDDTAGPPPTKSTTAAQRTTSSPTKTTPSGGGGRQWGRLGDPHTPVEAVLTSSDPADTCGRFVTKHYLEIAYGGKQGCVQAQAPGSAARSLRDFRVAINHVASNGTLTADATVVPVGGPYDGEKVEVFLVGHLDRQALDGQGELLRSGWRIFQLEANVPVGP
jgi:hypothetical protein